MLLLIPTELDDEDELLKPLLELLSPKLLDSPWLLESPKELDEDSPIELDEDNPRLLLIPKLLDELAELLDSPILDELDKPIDEESPCELLLDKPALEDKPAELLLKPQLLDSSCPDNEAYILIVFDPSVILIMSRVTPAVNSPVLNCEIKLIELLSFL